MNEKIVIDFLKSNNVAYTLFKHQPVFTVEDKPILVESGEIGTIPGLQSKNLFLKDKKNSKFYLVSVSEDKRVDLRALSDRLCSARFSFGSPEELLDLIKLTPGSVTPFGLLFDELKKVTFILDEDFLTTTFVNFHPMRNDMTVGLVQQDFLSCMEKMGHKPIIIKIPVKNL